MKISKVVLVVAMVVATGSCQLYPKAVCPKVRNYLSLSDCGRVRDRCRSDGDCKRVGGQCCPNQCSLSCQKTVKPASCSEPIDLALLIDSSGSISNRNWIKVKNFAKKLIDLYDISESGTRVAIITYSTSPKVNIKFNKYRGAQLNAVNIKRDIDKLRHQKGFTFIDKALKMANNEIFTVQAGMRKGVRKACIVFTDGKQTTKKGPYTRLDVASRPLKQKGVDVYSLGVGRFNRRNLIEMASTPVPTHVFTASNFNQLSQKASEIAKTQCRVRCRKAIDLAVLLDSSGSISRTNWGKVKKFTKDLVDIFRVSDKGSHVAIITYSTKPHVDLKFNTYTGRQRNSANIKRVIDRLPHQRGFTYIDKALQTADKQIFTVGAGMRRSVPKLCIVLTDGAQTIDKGPFTNLRIASRPLKRKGVQIYSLGVGNDVEVMELIYMATVPNNVYNAKKFDELSKKAKEISEAYCKVDSVSGRI